MGFDREQLNQLTIASPCHESWDRMSGDEQVRHCARCDKQVYNLSTMRLEEIAALVDEKEGRMCVRFYKRADGTVLTEDCPVGFRAAVRRRLALAAAFIAGVWASAATFAQNCYAGALKVPPSVKPYASPKPSPSASAKCDGVIMMGAPPPPPQKVLVNFKVKGIAGSHPTYVATIEFEGQTYMVQKNTRVPEQNPAFEVKEVAAEKVTVFDFKAQRLVPKQLITE